MEPPQQQQNDQDSSGGGGSRRGGEGGGGSSPSYLCRPSGTRWTPTSEQIRILKDLYYNNGVRSPSADQIQKISARLRQYGKIEGKNVFYWFQNHKARERQKKRFTSTTSDIITHPMQQDHNTTTATTPSPTPGAVFGSIGHVGSYASFRSAGGGFGWVGNVDHHPYNYSQPYTTTPLFDQHKRSPNDLSLEEHQEQEDEEAAPEIETLPLFPTHSENINGFCYNDNSNYYYYSHGQYYTDWYHSGGDGASRASLELSLNSGISTD